MTFRMIFSLVFLSTIAGGDDQYWPGWLGPDRDGWVADFVPPADWPKSLHQLWKLEVGTGYGSPLVAEGRVFQHARQGEREGHLVGSISTPVRRFGRRRVPFHFKSGAVPRNMAKGPKSCPVYSDGRVFTMSITGTLSAWDAQTGEHLWSTEYEKEFGKNHPYWGASTSPIVDGDRVITHFGTDETGALIAIDVESGQEIWRQGESGASYSSPLVAEIEGVRQVVDWNHDSVVGVNVESGELLWEYPYPHEGTNQNMPTPAIWREHILVGGENRGVLCIHPQRSTETWTVAKKWHQDDVALRHEFCSAQRPIYYLACHTTTKVASSHSTRTMDKSSGRDLPGREKM